jgi:membrane-bound lytic murein transglycosylase D
MAAGEAAGGPAPTGEEAAGSESGYASGPSGGEGDVLDRELSLIFAEFGIDTQEEPLPPTLVATVQRCVDFWTQQRRDATLRAIRRSGQYLPMIQVKLARAKIPAVFAYLPFVESAFVTGAESGAHAVGLWQLMAGTARDYGLRVDGQVDERNDAEKATDAACKHLAMLLMRYGTNDCLCAVAAYNKGDNGLLNCLLQSGVDWRSDRKFWDLVSRDASCLPQETRDYVPRFLAAVIVMRRPDQFGLAGG